MSCRDSDGQDIDVVEGYANLCQTRVYCWKLMQVNASGTCILLDTCDLSGCLAGILLWPCAKAY